MPPYLLSRGMDPFLGLFTGVLAYYLHETHPRTALQEEERLTELLRWKYDKYQEQKRQDSLALDAAS
ncbi:hypothetical protein B0H34DRAFT_795082 [Crassisporium funariophilum]|nr:hypothetical protein B0H34DRAFT_795082 [Crassisporium funariophilum]